MAVRTESGGDGSPKSSCFSDSVWIELQTMIYGLRLLSTRALRVDCRVKLIGVSLQEGVGG